MADPYEVRRSGYGWAVFNRETRAKVSPQLSTKGLAQSRCDAMNDDGRKTRRPCITCRTPFLSEGPHNRMCPGCRTGSQPTDWMARVIT